MAEPSSRRSFLFGRQATALDDWSRFVVNLRRHCAGKVRLLSDWQAHLCPKTLDDVIEARRLCQEYGVVLALDGLPLAKQDHARTVLWVEAGSSWGTLIPLGQTGLWRVDAGCPLAVTEAAGLVRAPADSGAANLAHWFATTYRGTPLAGTSLGSQLVSVDWLLPDGTIEVFGAFGAKDSQPLGSLAAQKLVPKLFELSLCPEVQTALGHAHWPLAFHLDALVDVGHVNLAHFYLGHGGALGWLVAATFRQSGRPLEAPESKTPHPTDTARDLDLRIKQIVDPAAVFMSMAEQTG